MLTFSILADGLAAWKTEKKINPNGGLLKGIRLGSPEQKAGYACLAQEGEDVVCSSGQDRIRIIGVMLADVFNVVSALQEKLQNWQADLDNCLERGGSLTELLRLSEPVLKNPIFVVDQREIVYAMTDHPPGTVHAEWDYMRRFGRMPFPRVSAIYQESDFKNIRRASEYDGEPFIFQPPGLNYRGINYRIPDPLADSILSILVIIENETPITEGMIHLSRTLNRAVVRWTRLHSDEHGMKNISHLFTDFLDGTIIDDDEINMNKALNNLNHDHYILAAIPAGNGRRLQYLAPALECELGRSRCFEYESHLLAFCPLEPDLDTVIQTLQNLSERMDFRIGLSYPFSSWRALKSAFRQAVIALEFSRDRLAGLASGSALRYLISELASPMTDCDLTHPAINELADYDRRHGTQYHDTLYSYLKNERNLIRTAAELFIHRNSLVYRIARIHELIRVNLNDFNERQHLLLSYLGKLRNLD